MTAFRLSYLFYVGIILPTVVTLALFVFFVICWRKQSARKLVLTKPYDPHGTMRKLGIPNTPPPPPLFLHHRGGLITPTSELGGEDNAAYDMSRSPSAEAGAAGKTGGRPAPFQASPLCVQLDSSIRQLQLHASPSGELELTGRLAFHSHLDSGLSEPVCESPGAVSHGGGGGVGAGGGGGGGVSSRDRPQSQASHSSHSTDSEDSGFRSARSGQLSHQGHYEPPMLRRSRSAKRGKGRGCYHRAATSSPDSDTEPSLPLTPTALWSNPNTTPHHPNTAPHHPHTSTCHHHHPHHQQHQHHQCSPDHLLHSGGEETVTTNSIGLDLLETDTTTTTNLGWKYLQELSSPGHKVKEKASGLSGPGHGKGLTCQQSMTLAQVHTSHDLDNPDILGFSVV